MTSFTSTNPIVRLITFIINYFDQSHESPSTNQSISTNQPIQRNIHRRRRNRHRHQSNRYRRINLGNNHTRGCIIYRARQITQQNRLIAAQAEQNLICAILKAREEIQTISRQIRSVPAVHTQNERPPRPVRRQEAEQGSTEATETL